jgi:hypothetical protein
MQILQVSTYRLDRATELEPNFLYLARDRPQGSDSVMPVTSSDPAELFAHAEKYHGKAIGMLKSQLYRLP